MAGLLSYAPGRNTGLGGAGGEAGPKRMTGKGAWVIAGGGDPLPNDQTDGLD